MFFVLKPLHCLYIDGWTCIGWELISADILIVIGNDLVVLYFKEVHNCLIFISERWSRDWMLVVVDILLTMSRTSHEDLLWHDILLKQNIDRRNSGVVCCFFIVSIVHSSALTYPEGLLVMQRHNSYSLKYLYCLWSHMMDVVVVVLQFRFFEFLVTSIYSCWVRY